MKSQDTSRGIKDRDMAYVQKIGTPQFPRYVMRDGIGQFWTGTGWSEDPRRGCSLLHRRRCGRRREAFCGRRTRPGHLHSDSGHLPTRTPGHGKNWSTTSHASARLSYTRARKDVASSLRCTGMICRRRNRLRSVTMDLLKLLTGWGRRRPLRWHLPNRTCRGCGSSAAASLDPLHADRS